MWVGRNDFTAHYTRESRFVAVLQETTHYSRSGGKTRESRVKGLFKSSRDFLESYLSAFSIKKDKVWNVMLPSYPNLATKEDMKTEASCSKTSLSHAHMEEGSLATQVYITKLQHLHTSWGTVGRQQCINCGRCFLKVVKAFVPTRMIRSRPAALYKCISCVYFGPSP